MAPLIEIDALVKSYTTASGPLTVSGQTSYTADLTVPPQVRATA